jgi:hypothetical protein
LFGYSSSLAYKAVIFLLEVVHPVAVPITEGYFALFAIICGIVANSMSLAHPASAFSS